MPDRGAEMYDVFHWQQHCTTNTHRSYDSDCDKAGFVATDADLVQPIELCKSQAHLPSFKVTVINSPVQSTTTRLLQHLKGLQHEHPPEPSESFLTIFLAGRM
jgi:hypothetical protein